MLVLGIESTCDETACAIVRSGRDILSNVVASQHDVHASYGGVFPELACRRHIDVIIPVIERALDEAKVSKKEIDLIAVAKGPGLIGALLIGLNTAKGLALGLKKPFVGVNHVEAHLYASMMHQESPILPAIGVVISGGHTFLWHIHQLGSYTLIGSTADDAIGESFDKVASMLGLPYPGGPAIEELAKLGNPSRFPLKAGRVKGKPLDFSFSGLKTSVLYALKGANAKRQAPDAITQEEKADLAAAFQEAALGDIVDKALLATAATKSRAIYFGGGVSNNRRLREIFVERKEEIQETPVFWPPCNLSLDNAAMIAGLGYHYFIHQGGDSLDLIPSTRISLS